MKSLQRLNKACKGLEQLTKGEKVKLTRAARTREKAYLQALIKLL